MSGRTVYKASLLLPEKSNDPVPKTGQAVEICHTVRTPSGLFSLTLTLLFVSLESHKTHCDRL